MPKNAKIELFCAFKSNKRSHFGGDSFGYTCSHSARGHKPAALPKVRAKRENGRTQEVKLVYVESTNLDTDWSARWANTKFKAFAVPARAKHRFVHIILKDFRYYDAKAADVLAAAETVFGEYSPGKSIVRHILAFSD